MSARPYFADALKVAEVRLFIGQVACFTLASRALAVVIGFQIYQITKSPMALGILGLVEAIPAITLVLFGGHVADHFNRRRILLTTRAASVLCAGVLAWISMGGHNQTSVPGLYAVIFLAGIARGFSDPASAALEAQVVPKTLTVNASSWISSTWVFCSVLGPAAIGFIFDAWGAHGSYVLIAFFFALSWICMACISSKPQLKQEREPILKSIGMGWHFIGKNQELLGAMTLDLFAVLFGGAIALLPVYAADILHVGAKGLGILNAAPSFGAMLVMLGATHRPPIANAGRNLVFSVGGFGVCMLVFGLSRNFYLSLAALFVSGIFDGVSMVIRRSMIRLLSPDYLRGRIAAANSIFISASNELGAFESGLVAAWIGTVPCVAVGSVVTLLITAAAATFFPKLRNLRFHPVTLEKIA